MNDAVFYGHCRFYRRACRRRNEITCAIPDFKAIYGDVCCCDVKNGCNVSCIYNGLGRRAGGAKSRSSAGVYIFFRAINSQCFVYSNDRSNGINTGTQLKYISCRSRSDRGSNCGVPGIVRRIVYASNCKRRLIIRAAIAVIKRIWTPATAIGIAFKIDF